MGSDGGRKGKNPEKRKVKRKGLRERDLEREIKELKMFSFLRESTFYTP